MVEIEHLDIWARILMDKLLTQEELAKLSQKDALEITKRRIKVIASRGILEKMIRGGISGEEVKKISEIIREIKAEQLKAGVDVDQIDKSVRSALAFREAVEQTLYSREKIARDSRGEYQPPSVMRPKGEMELPKKKKPPETPYHA